MATRTITVRGMTCEHCANKVREEVRRLSEVTGIEVDLSNGRVTVASVPAIDETVLRAAVERAGYEVVRTDNVQY